MSLGWQAAGPAGGTTGATVGGTVAGEAVGGGGCVGAAAATDGTAVAVDVGVDTGVDVADPATSGVDVMVGGGVTAPDAVELADVVPGTTVVVPPEQATISTIPTTIHLRRTCRG